MDIPPIVRLTHSVSTLLSRRTLTSVLGLCALARPGLAASKRKRGKTKAVTKRFSNEGTIAIPAVGSTDGFGPADPYPSTIDVAGFKGKAKISDVNLILHGLSHTSAHAIIILLVAPGGRNVVVLGGVGINDNEGGGAVDDLALTLDDEADMALPVDEPLTSGAFRPRNTASQLPFPDPAPTPSDEVALSTFDGGNPNGQWRLFIVSAGADDTGSLVDGWSLEITAKSKARRKHKHKKRH